MASYLLALALTSAAPSLPLVFEENHGQVEGPAQFLARRPGASFLFGPDGALLLVDAGHGARRAIRVGFADSLPVARLEGEQPLAGRAHYLIGPDPRAWHTDVPLYGRVLYRDLYPAVDLAVRGAAGDVVEYDFLVAPGGDPHGLALRFDGARGLTLDAAGDLHLATDEGELIQRRPVAYQDVAGARLEVAARFVLRGPDTVGFEVGGYDPTATLVIDPPLSYSTFIGGDGSDRVNAVAVDADGKVYVTGETTSLAGPLANDFPTKDPIPGGEQLDSYSLPPPDPRPFPSIRKYDAFVGKLDTTQAGPDSLVYMTFLGGGLGDERAFAIAVDGGGRAHVGGVTSSRDLPLVNALQTCVNGAGDFVCDLNLSFVARLSASGSTLEYSSYLNGNDVDVVGALAVGPLGRLFVGGRTASTFNFPISPTALQTTNHGVFDAFLTVLDLAATPPQQVVYSTLIGGCADDDVQALAVDAQGRAVLAGQTQNPCPNPATRLPIKDAIQPAYAGGLSDSFVAAIDPAAAGAAGLGFSTFLGGKDDENDLRKSGLALDSAGRIFLGGTTSSANFPTTPSAAQRCPGMTAANAQLYPCDPATGQFAGALPPNGVILDGYVTVLSPAGALLESTFLGGAGQDSIQDLDVRADGAFAYVTGSTTTTGLGSTCAAQPQLSLGRDAFQSTVRFGAGWSSTRTFFTYIGGGSDDFGDGIAYDAVTGSLFVGGYATFNTSTTKLFPTTSNALQPTQPGSPAIGFENGFLSQIPKPAACAPDLVIRKFASPEPASAGCGLTYTIEVQNLGVLPASQVVVTDPLPAPLLLDAATVTKGSCSGGSTLTCAIGSLVVGEQVTITILATLDGGYASTQSPIVNTATVTALEADADPSDDSASWTTHIVPGSDGDGDGAIDCVDACPDDPQKTDPGLCGCGAEDYPQITVSDAPVTEGNAGTTTALFTVSLAHDTCVDLSFAYATAPDADPAFAATPGVDYVDAAGTFTIVAGATSFPVGVAVVGDTDVEPDETYRLVVTPDFAGATYVGTGTIVADDVPPVVSLAGAATVAEGDAAIYDFTVVAGGPFTVAVASCGGGAMVGVVATTPSGGSFTCVFADGPDATQVEVQVESGGAPSNLATIAVTVANVAPSVALTGAAAVAEGDTALYGFVVTDPGSDGFALLAGSPDCGAAGALVAGSLALDPSGSGGSFECWFPDGDAISTVAVAVADSDGAASASATLDVAVANVEPSVVLDGPTAAAEGDTLTYTLSVFDPGDEAVAVQEAACGDAGTLVSGSLVVAPAQGPGGLKATGSFQCLFAAGPATSTVSVAAADSAGPGAAAQLQVVVDDVAPIVDLVGPAGVDEGQVATLSFGVDAGSDGFTVAPGFPDCGALAAFVPGSLVTDASGGSFACAFPNGPASAAVRIQVVDSDGKGSNIAVFAVAVQNVAPTATLSGPTPVASGATATFQFAAADAGGDAFSVGAGYPSCGAAGALVAGSLAVNALGGSFQCAFGAGPATSQVAIAVTDADGGAGAAATFDVAIDAPANQVGWMVGHGTVLAAGQPVKLAFSLSCDTASGTKNLHLQWAGHKLKLEQVTSSSCTDDPAISPGQPAVPFDTLAGAGTGRYDGVPGYGVELVFSDAGEPGAADGVHVTITDPQGGVVFDVAGTLVQGNNDAQQ